jgi:hypothetical protein
MFDCTSLNRVDRFFHLLIIHHFNLASCFAVLRRRASAFSHFSNQTCLHRFRIACASAKASATRGQQSKAGKAGIECSSIVIQIDLRLTINEC